MLDSLLARVPPKVILPGYLPNSEVQEFPDLDEVLVAITGLTDK